MKIAYYISDYGYGHATRSIALIRRLMIQNPNLEITICHSFAINLLKVSLSGFNIKYRIIETDIGYMTQKGAIDIAPSLMKAKYKEWIKQKNQWVTEEARFLKIKHIDLVITDISPFAIDAAKKCNIRSIAISNFTWYSAYQEFLNEDELKPLYESYSKLDYFLHLACSNERKWGSFEKNYKFFSRKANKKEINRIKDEIDPTRKCFTVFFGLGMKFDNIDLNSLPIWSSENCKFIVSSNMKINHPNVIKIPMSYSESQNYIAASKLVISKAGWGTVSEAVCNHVPVMLLEREMMNEDSNTIKYVKRHHLGISINQDDLKELVIDHKMMDISSQFDFSEWNNEEDEIAIFVSNLLMNS
jgi:uncharacterized protein (TIGR00661 family)